MPDGDTFDPGSAMARLRTETPAVASPASPAPPLEASTPTAQKASSPQEMIVAEFTGAGYPRHVAEGIARRSGFEGQPNSVVTDSNGLPSMGMFQENGPNAQGLLKYAAQTGQNPLDPKTQIKFAMTRVEQIPGLKSRLMNAKTREDGYDFWTRGYEKPKDPNDHGPGGLNLPATGELPPWMKGGGEEQNVFREMRAKQFGATQSAMEHLGLARAAEAKMLETAPKPQPTQPAEQWSSMAMAVAALGGLLTHTPLTTSMNAMAGVLNAFKENDKERAAQQFQEWKASHETAIRMADMEIKQYEAAIRQAGSAPREAQAQMAALTASYKNDFANKLWNEGRVDEALAVHAGLAGSLGNLTNSGKNFEAQAKLAVANQIRQDHPEWNQSQVYLEAERQMHGAANAGALEKDSVKRMLQMEHPDWEEGKLNIEADKVISGAKKSATGGAGAAKERDAQTLATEAFKEKYGRDPDPNNFNDKANMARLTNEQRQELAGVISDEAADFAARRVVIGGDEAALTGMARSNANITKVTNHIVKVAKEAGLSAEQVAVRVAQFKGVVAGERTLGTRQANMGVAANEVKLMSPLALDASNKVDRTEYPTLNSLLLAAERGTGDQNVVRFSLAANSLIYSFSKFLNPTGIPTDADKAKATDILSLAWSKGQFNTAIDQIQREIATGRGAVEATREEFLQALTRTIDSGGAGPKAADAPKPAELIEGHVYEDASGRKAKWQGGKWVAP